MFVKLCWVKTKYILICQCRPAGATLYFQSLQKLLCGTGDLSHVKSLEICVDTRENTLGNFGKIYGALNTVTHSIIKHFYVFLHCVKLCSSLHGQIDKTHLVTVTHTMYWSSCQVCQLQDKMTELIIVDDILIKLTFVLRKSCISQWVQAWRSMCELCLACYYRCSSFSIPLGWTSAELILELCSEASLKSSKWCPPVSLKRESCVCLSGCLVGTFLPRLVQLRLNNSLIQSIR